MAKSRLALDAADTDYFAATMPRSEYYRILLTFPQETLFVDIETTGLSRWYDYTTVVGWEMNNAFHVHIKGSSTDAMYAAFARAKAIVTFNGTLFDIPFLLKEFPGLSIPLCHVDLRFFSRRADVSGGQKVIEKQLGIQREGELKELSGETAPILWHNYRWGELDALKLLIEYNHADIQGLKLILDSVIARLVKKNGVPAEIVPAHHFYQGASAIRFSDSDAQEDAIHIEPYRGNPGPSITFQELCLDDHRRIVGIDLTGSESRPSGWCLLDGATATTLRVGSDDDLVRLTVEAKPSLVSIDSPLSLPKGRTTVFDDDINRQSHGIMRECERILKKRGINVYPSLIPSMQRLTQRGIALANRFRSLGLPVIESYPGAAQDILGIPRKRAGLQFLVDGLQRFGIEGAFAESMVSHDELDAITSAVVGLFFWAGRFEALGNEEEEYLIIPDIPNGDNRWDSHHVIGLSGPISSGKTTAGCLLRERGYHYGRYSQVLQAIATERGLPSTRENLQEIGQEMFEGHQQRYLGKYLLRLMPTATNLVIDGLRHPEDYAFLVETFGPTFHHFYIEADYKVRQERYGAAGFTKTDFETAVAHPVEVQIPMLRDFAEQVIPNNDSKEAYINRIHTLLMSIEKESVGQTCR